MVDQISVALANTRDEQQRHHPRENQGVCFLCVSMQKSTGLANERPPSMVPFEIATTAVKHAELSCSRRLKNLTSLA